jgi:hypothetical protein
MTGIVTGGVYLTTAFAALSGKSGVAAAAVQVLAAARLHGLVTLDSICPALSVQKRWESHNLTVAATTSVLLLVHAVTHLEVVLMVVSLTSAVLV